ncbi:MAG TPA: hypothetical protein VNJ01_02115 [Bacteriovoracaceae bacterium]|nr:hypothetical protein [Bacteriovoracaceae bacterium]
MTQKILLIFFFLSTTAVAADLRGRLGVGASNQLANGVPALSLKIQQDKSFALGAILGFQANQDTTLYGAGLKAYRIIYDEPQLNFYLAGLFASESYLDKDQKAKSGYQIDGTLGSEFHFAGIESLGFSVEFGLSVRNANEEGGTSFETVGDHLVKAAVHFYL